MSFSGRSKRLAAMDEGPRVSRGDSFADRWESGPPEKDGQEVTTDKVRFRERREIAGWFTGMVEPIAGRADCKIEELEPLIRFVDKHLELFRLICAEPLDEGEGKVRQWLIELASLPPGLRSSLFFPETARLRVAFGGVPRPKGSVLLSALDGRPGAVAGQGSGQVIIRRLSRRVSAPSSSHQ